MRTRARRRAVILEELRGGRVRNQAELLARLGRRGVGATQATLSRDLRDLGVLKGPGGYVLARGPEGSGRMAGAGGAGGAGGGRGAGGAGVAEAAALREAVAGYLRSAETAGALVVLRTGPGQAPALALALDEARLAGVLGTVAGDDTVFVAAASARAAGSLRRRLLGAGGVAAPDRRAS